MSNEFKSKLIASDSPNPALRAEYEQKLNAMLESPLNPARKAGLLFGVVVGIGTAILGAVLLARFHNGPAAMVGGFVVGIVFGLAIAVVAGRILLRGTYRHRHDSAAQTGVIWVFIVLLTTLFMMLDGLHPHDPPRLTIFGLVFLVGAAAMLLRTVIEQAELRTREKLLEIQYEMAEMREAMSKAR